MTEPDLGVLYRDSRQRVTDLVATLDEDALAKPAPACPGWSVFDVVSHLVGTTEDVLAGKLTGPPSEEMTAAEVDRHKGQPVTELLDTWSEIAPQFEPIIRDVRIWPAVIDIVSHEHDIRGGLSHPGDRDTEALRLSADTLLGYLQPPVPLLVKLEDSEILRGGVTDEPLVLTTTRFEVLRFRMGRRSRAQLQAMSWSGDAEPIIDSLVVFGPAEADILE